jgi:ribosomal protein L11 methylase PrmA
MECRTRAGAAAYHHDGNDGNGTNGDDTCRAAAAQHHPQSQGQGPILLTRNMRICNSLYICYISLVLIIIVLDMHATPLCVRAWTMTSYTGSLSSCPQLQLQQQRHIHLYQQPRQRRPIAFQSALFASSAGGPADWIVEGLEDDDDETTNATEQEAGAVGENDIFPEGGLHIGCFHITAMSSATPAEADVVESDNTDNNSIIPIQLLARPNGWGSGVHPTTRLCLEFLEKVMVSGDDSESEDGPVVLDYGCGSGVLSIASLGLGASHVVGVDIEAEALVTAHKNLQLNGYSGSRGDEDGDGDGDDESSTTQTYELLHTRQIQPYDLSYSPTGGADICVANILIGQLVRPSMVAALITNLKSSGGAYLCLSGIRPGPQVEALKAAYSDHLEWQEDLYGELDAQDTVGSAESYGFDVGAWARVVGRLKKNHTIDIAALSDMAVS